MKRIAQLASLAALAATIIPPLLFFLGHLGLDAAKAWMLAGTIVWFVTTPLWMDR